MNKTSEAISVILNPSQALLKDLGVFNWSIYEQSC